MAFKFCSFASGSSGNCYMARSESTTILIDVGITGKRILEGLATHDMAAEDVDGILVTHEHTDHVKSLKMLSKKATSAKVYGSAGTLSAVMEKIEGDKARAIGASERLQIGDITVLPFGISHDAAEPLGYSLIHQGRQVTIVTDTGYISEEIFAQIVKADLLVLEANHEVNILKMGAYPYYLKRRILGDEGHLSNEAAGECLCKMLRERQEKGCMEMPQVVLAHLSRENNTPEQAYLTIRNILFEKDFYIDKDLMLDIAKRDQIGKEMEI
ncbi:MBL fold metallo-hydrolase [Anaerovoracaceae bacterium 42-11]|nr:MBL fold metallo-hydrolase [Emergencia sp.]